MHLAVEDITKKIHIEKNTNILLNEVISVIKFVLSCTYFIFNKTIYKQTYNTPMGSPLLPINAVRSQGKSVRYDTLKFIFLLLICRRHRVLAACQDLLLLIF